MPVRSKQSTGSKNEAKSSNGVLKRKSKASEPEPSEPEAQVPRKPLVKRSLKSVSEVGDMDATEYKGMDDREHIYNRPDMVLGSDRRIDREVWIYDVNKKQMIRAKTDIPYAVEKMSDEIIVNASDNSARSMKKGVDPGPIEILVDQQTFTVKNYGVPFTIAKCKEPGYEDLWIPEYVLGIAKTSSNYGAVVHEGGKNGYGAKGVNVMSTDFEVELYNSYRKKYYYQKWTDNMLNKSKPKIKDYDGEESSTRITYTCDFARFKMTEYDDTMIGLFARHAADLSYTTKNKVIFNEIVFKTQSPQDYARLYFGDNVKYSMLFYQWPEGTEVETDKNGVQTAVDGITKPILEVLLVDTPGDAQVVSFANGIMTKKDGIHVDVAYELLRPILKLVNDGPEKRQTKKKPGTKGAKKKPEKAKIKLDIRAVKEHVSILVSAWVENASFDSQSKNQLQACDNSLKLVADEKQMIKLKKWRLMKALEANLKSKRLVELAKKTDGRKISDIDEGKGIDANDAGGPNSEDCTLFLCEGDSAKPYTVHIQSITEGDTDRYGVYPLRGKPLNFLNAMNSTSNEDQIAGRIANNKEFYYIKQYLGLKEELDYTDDRNFKTLRYGRVWIFPDADVDGKHIAGLVLLLFASLYPSLLKRQNFLYIWTSPIIEAKIKKQKTFFYTEGEYKEWAQSLSKQGDKTGKKITHEAHYTKGLGGCDKKRIDQYDSPNRRLKALVFDKRAILSVHLAFSNKKRRERKDWINSWDQEEAEEILNSLPWKRLKNYPKGRMIEEPIQTYINHEVKEYGHAANNRCLGDMDGLKPAHKKLLYGARVKFNVGKIGKSYKKIKSAQFCTAAAEITHYHHGEGALYPTMILMSQDFVGANNIPLFTVKAVGVGSRLDNGKTYSAERYSFVTPSRYIPYLFREEDELIYDFNIDEGKPTEPKRFYPILPISLLNGVEGIGVGFRHLNLPYNPYDLVAFIEAYITGETPDNLTPWYHGFKGKIKVVYTHDKSTRPTAVDFDAKDETEVKSADSGKKKSESDANRTKKDSEESEASDREDDEEVITEDQMEEHFERAHKANRRHQVKDDVKKHKLSAIIKGCYKVNGAEVHITEIPIRISCERYKKKIVPLLKEEKIIRSCRYKCKDDGTISFFLGGFNREKTPSHTLFHLVDQIGISNLVFMGNNQRAHVFESIETYFKAWIDERLEKYEERRQKMILRFKQEIDKKEQRIRFINGVMDGIITLKIRGQNQKERILQQMAKLKIDKEILKTTTSLQFTDKHIDKLKADIEKIRDQLREYENIKPEDLWRRELKEFLTALPRSFMKTRRTQASDSDEEQTGSERKKRTIKK